MFCIIKTVINLFAVQNVVDAPHNYHSYLFVSVHAVFRKMGHIANRQLVRLPWVYHGKKVRVVLSSRALRTIRDIYPPDAFNSFKQQWTVLGVLIITTLNMNVLFNNFNHYVNIFSHGKCFPNFTMYCSFCWDYYYHLTKMVKWRVLMFYVDHFSMFCVCFFISLTMSALWYYKAIPVLHRDIVHK